MTRKESPSKETIIREIRRLQAQEGRTPGQKLFASRTGIPQHAWSGRFWVKWEDAVREAGFAPNTWTTAIPEEELLAHQARIARSLGHFPTDRELDFAHAQDPALPSRAVYRRRFRSKAKRFASLQAWVSERLEFADVAAVLSHEEAPPKPAIISSPPAAESRLDLSESWMPPIVACLPRLALGEGPNADLEFERRVAVAFRLLGLSVQELGQGHGRAADYLAVCRERHWAVICDAKSRVGGFTFNATEERKFKEYIDRHERELRPDEIEKVYLVVVSSDFSGECPGLC